MEVLNFKKSNINTNKNFLVTTEYLLSKLPSDIIFKIFHKYQLLEICKKKWNLIYTKLKFSKNEIIMYIHGYHDFARKITECGHLCYDNDYNEFAMKLINLSTKIHFLASLLIKETIIKKTIL